MIKSDNNYFSKVVTAIAIRGAILNSGQFNSTIGVFADFRWTNIIYFCRLYIYNIDPIYKILDTLVFNHDGYKMSQKVFKSYKIISISRIE